MKKNKVRKGRGKFYHVEVRLARRYDKIRTHDVGQKGGLERVAGARVNKEGKEAWETVTWLVSKNDAKVEDGELKVLNPKVKTFLKSICGKVEHVKGDVFRAKPKN